MEHSNHYIGEVPNHPNVLRFPSLPAHTRVRGEVEFRNVSFQHTVCGRKLISDISFRVAPGTRVGIAGPSGSGKSTLVKLLTRFYQPSCGAILLDGIDLREYRPAELRQQFSIVLQQPKLWASTVAGNIACVDPRASRADVVRAAKLANAHQFIERLPHRYNTIVGEGGAVFSAAERQRLAIARAFLKDAPMLIVDEPAAADDPHIRRLNMHAMDRLTAGRTTFMVAHRIATLERCDMVLVLNNGSVRAICRGDERPEILRRARTAPGHVPHSNVPHSNVPHSHGADPNIARNIQRSIDMPRRGPVPVPTTN